MFYEGSYHHNDDLLDSEWSVECIDFTIMEFFFLWIIKFGQKLPFAP